MPRPLKPFCSIEGQVQKLVDRGMEVTDVAEAKDVLLHINYYRFTGYAFQFRKPNDKYRKCSFDNIIRLYRFEQALRSALFSSIEDIEIYARTQIAYYFSREHGEAGHYDASNFVDAQYHEEYIEALETQMRKNKNSAFVSHHIYEYGGKMPLWCAVEIMSFSTLSKFYSNMLPADRELVAQSMGVKPSYLTNWLHCVSVLRNTCAHYGRIYNNLLSPKIMLDPKTLRRFPMVRTDTLFAYLVAMIRFCPNRDRSAKLKEQITYLMDEYTDVIELGLLGFPHEWRILLEDNVLFEI